MSAGLFQRLVLVVLASHNCYHDYIKMDRLQRDVVRGRGRTGPEENPLHFCFRAKKRARNKVRSSFTELARLQFKGLGC